MASQNEALQQAKALLDELAAAARSGAIIPVRLPGQIEAIGQLIEQAQSADAAPAAAVPPDLDAYRHETASFISIAVHELRTPMTSIRGYSDMLANPAMGSVSDMQQQFIDVIRTNARRMEGLLTDVGDMNKLRADTLNVNPKMDMYKNIAMLVEKKMRPVADELKRGLTFDTPSGLPILETDGELLAKALGKLIENGLRYSLPETGLVNVRASGAGGDLHIVIEDNGIGMSADELARLGEIYYRADHELVRSYKGSGLGIPVAYGIIRALGGSVDVVSQPDQGTTFTVRLRGMN